MNKFPLSVNKPELPEEVQEVRQELQPNVQREIAEALPAHPFGPFLNFHFSYTEVSSRDGSTRVSSRHARLQGGKLSTSSFEGELPSDVYGQAVAQVQRQFLDQAELMMRSLTWFLPRSLRLPFERD